MGITQVCAFGLTCCTDADFDAKWYLRKDWTSHSGTYIWLVENPRGISGVDQDQLVSVPVGNTLTRSLRQRTCAVTDKNTHTPCSSSHHQPRPNTLELGGLVWFSIDQRLLNIKSSGNAFWSNCKSNNGQKRGMAKSYSVHRWRYKAKADIPTPL